MLFSHFPKDYYSHVHVQTRYDAMLNSTGTGKEILSPVDENREFTDENYQFFGVVCLISIR